jgi:hypothetical protein
MKRFAASAFLTLLLVFVLAVVAGANLGPTELQLSVLLALIVGAVAAVWPRLPAVARWLGRRIG